MALNTSIGSFIPTTSVWDVSEIYSTEVTSPEFKELLVRLYQNLNNMSLSINTRDAGYYTTQEFVNGQLLFPNPLLNSSSPTSPTQRQIYRKVINFGTLPNAAALSINHGIIFTSACTITRLYGAASNTTGLAYIPIPYSSATAVADNIELSANNLQVTITTGANYSAFNQCYVIIEYVKS